MRVNGTDVDIEFEIETRLDPGRLLVLVKGDFTLADFGMSAPTSRSFVVKDDVHVEVLVSAMPKYSVLIGCRTLTVLVNNLRLSRW